MKKFKEVFKKNSDTIAIAFISVITVIIGTIAVGFVPSFLITKVIIQLPIKKIKLKK